MSEDTPSGRGRHERTRNGSNRGDGADGASHRRGAFRRCHRRAVMVVTARRWRPSNAKRRGRDVVATRRACNNLVMRLARCCASIQHSRKRRDGKRDHGCCGNSRRPGHQSDSIRWQGPTDLFRVFVGFVFFVVRARQLHRRSRDQDGLVVQERISRTPDLL